MCVRIISDDSEVKFDTEKPLEEQLNGSHNVLIKYEPNDPSIDKFICEVERLCKRGISADIKVEVQHNGHIKGQKAKKQLKRLTKDLGLNEAIKLLVNMQRKSDITLEELANFCKNK